MLEKTTRPHRRDGGCGQRRALLLSHYQPDNDHPTCELRIDEVAPDGSSSELMRRRRVDKPDMERDRNVLERLHPKGQPGGLHAKLSDLLLQIRYIAFPKCNDL